MEGQSGLGGVGEAHGVAGVAGEFTQKVAISGCHQAIFGSPRGLLASIGLGRILGQQQGFPRLAQVPLHVVGQHAEKYVGADAILEPVVDGPDLEVHVFEAAEGALHLGQRLVGLSRLLGAHLLC